MHLPFLKTKKKKGKEKISSDVAYIIDFTHLLYVNVYKLTVDTISNIIHPFRHVQTAFISTMSHPFTLSPFS